FFGDLLSPSYAVVFAIDHELISVGRPSGSNGFVDALNVLGRAAIGGETVLPRGCRRHGIKIYVERQRPEHRLRGFHAIVRAARQQGSAFQLRANYGQQIYPHSSARWGLVYAPRSGLY